MAVSAVVPTYNREDVIERCLHSILRQSKPVDEIIVVDDASTDDTGQVVANLNHERVEFVRHDENRGAAAARNTGIERASGEFILFLDSDDVLHPTAVEKLHEVLTQRYPSCAGAFAHYQQVDSEGKVDRVWNGTTGVVTKDELSEYLAIPGISCSMIESNVLDAVNGFDERLFLSEDADLAYRIADIGDLYVIDDILYTCYSSGDQLTSYDGGENDELYRSSEQLLLEKHGDTLTNEHYIKRCVNAGFAALRTGNVAATHRHLAQAFSHAATNTERAFALQYIGRLCAHHGNTRTASRYFKRSLEYDVTRYPVYLYLLLSIFGDSVWSASRTVKRWVQIERYRLKQSIIPSIRENLRF